MRLTGDLADYFRDLFDYSTSLLDRLPVRLTPQPMDYVAEFLETALDQHRDGEVERIRALRRPPPRPPAGATWPVGMNTIGILADRLSILAIKHWSLTHKHKDAEGAARLYERDVEQIIAALCAARPGSENLLQKLSQLEVELHNADFEESYYGLMTSNLLMWEAQESMYLNNMADYDDAGVRQCLSWASYGNLRRNRYITSCEAQYWRIEDEGDVPAQAPSAAREVVNRRRTVLSPYVTVTERLVRELDGSSQVFHSVQQADYVTVLAQTAEGEVVLVRQFRPVVESVTLELPSGILEPQEDPQACAERELFEETGFRPTAPVTLLGRVLADTGRLENHIWAFFAPQVERAAGWTPEQGVEPVLLSKSEFTELVARGGLTEAQHLGLVALAQAQGRF